MPANILRGAFGLLLRKAACHCSVSGSHSADCVYARLFEPTAIAAGPSGLRDWPRPFVFRARHLDGRTVEPGERFHFEMNVFEIRIPVNHQLQAAFSQLSEDGLGPTRGHADLERLQRQKISLDLKPSAPAVNAVAIEFLTPTELKGGEELISRPEFPVLLARVRDRLSTLRSLYGPGPLDIDFAGMTARASDISMGHCEIRQAQTTRRSSRTGRHHPLGGFIGAAEYRGSLAEFLPFLEAAQWTGVGRQTVWGKGELSVRAL